ASGGTAPTPINPIGHPRAEVAALPNGELAFVVAAPFSAGAVAAADDEVALRENKDGSIVLENRALRAVLAADGSVLSLIHRDSGRDALASPGNRFVLFDDRPTEYEAWDIDPFALETGREVEAAERGSITSRGPLRCEVTFARALGRKSRLVQTIRLDAGAKHLTFDTEIDWHERRTLLKVMFPLNCKSPRATYETMFGAVERPTHANTDADLAQYEVPGHRW